MNKRYHIKNMYKHLNIIPSKMNCSFTDLSVQSDEGINESSLDDRVLLLERQIARLVTSAEEQKMQVREKYEIRYL